jgi:hypothetical protein
MDLSIELNTCRIQVRPESRSRLQVAYGRNNKLLTKSSESKKSSEHYQYQPARTFERKGDPCASLIKGVNNFVRKILGFPVNFTGQTVYPAKMENVVY